MDDSNRLDRIETKLDKLSEAVIDMARLEERLITLFNRMERIEETQVNIIRRVDELQEISNGRGHVIRFVERIFWIVLTAAVGSIFWIYRS